MTSRTTTRIRVCLALLLVSLAACAPWRWPRPDGPEPNLAEFVPTPMEVVDRMLELAEVTKDDVVYDLGSGDGRIVIQAAKRYGARGVGIDIDERLVWFSERSARRAGVDHLATFWRQDALTVEVSPATVVTLYLSREANLRLRPTLQAQLRPGSRIVSHRFDMGDWPPERVVRLTSGRGEGDPSGRGEERILYLWRIVK